MTDYHIKKRGSQDNLWNILYLLWFLKLFRPERLVSYYIPQLVELHKLPTIILLILTVLWFQSSVKKHNFKLIGLYLILLIISGIFAFNTARPRVVIRGMFEIYLMGMMTFSLVNDHEKIDKLFKLFLFYFLYFAIWGIAGMGVVWWDYFLNEEDAVGPLMCIGLGFCFQYYLSQDKGVIKKISLACSILCVAGVVASFARGAFLVLFTTICHIWVRSEHKIKGIFVLGLGVATILVAATLFFENNAFWDEMQTISDGTSKGTGRDRKVLWSVAWAEFCDNPFIGVGPNNFGIAAPRYIVKVANKGKYLDPGQIWGRALHNGFFQILCEQGIAGSLIFILIIYDFFRSNFRIKSKCFINTENNNELIEKKYFYILTGLEIGCVAYLLNAFFYDITYYPWFWNLIIINRLLCIHLQDRIQRA